MSRSAFNRPLRALALEISVNQSRGKGVTTADAVKDLQVLPASRLIKLAIHITDRAPIVDRRRFGLTKSCSDHGEGKRLHHALDRSLEGLDVNSTDVFVHSFHGETKRGRKVLFVADHHIHERCQSTIDFLRSTLSANTLPQ